MGNDESQSTPSQYKSQPGQQKPPRDNHASSGRSSQRPAQRGMDNIGNVGQGEDGKDDEFDTVSN